MTLASTQRLALQLQQALGLEREKLTSLTLCLEVDKPPVVHVTYFVRDETTLELVEALAQYTLVPRGQAEDFEEAARPA